MAVRFLTFMHTHTHTQSYVHPCVGVRDKENRDSLIEKQLNGANRGLQLHREPLSRTVKSSVAHVA